MPESAHAALSEETRAITRLPPLPAKAEYDAAAELAQLEPIVAQLTACLRSIEKTEESVEDLCDSVTVLAIAVVVLSYRVRAVGPHGSSERAEHCEKIIAAIQPANEAIVDLAVAGALPTWPAPMASAVYACTFAPIMGSHNSMPMPYGLGRLFGPKQNIDDEQVVTVAIPGAIAAMEDEAQHPVVRDFAMTLIAMGFGFAYTSSERLRQVFIDTDILKRFIATLPEGRPRIADGEDWDATNPIIVLFWDWPVTIANASRGGDSTMSRTSRARVWTLGWSRWPSLACKISNGWPMSPRWSRFSGASSTCWNGRRSWMVERRWCWPRQRAAAWTLSSYRQR